MNVCIPIKLMPAHGKGGMQDHALQLAQGLVRRGCRVTVLTTAHPDGITREEVDGVTVRYLEGTPPAQYSPEWWRESARALRAIAAQDKLDVVHIQSLAGHSLLAGGVLAELGIPSVVSFHGTCVDEIRTARLLLRKCARRPADIREQLARIFHFRIMHRKLALPTVALAGAVIATSNEQVEILRRHHHCPAEKIRVVYNGIDLALFPGGLADVPAPPRNGRATVLAVARMLEEKGIQYLLRALPAIARIGDVRATIVGDGPYRDRLEREARELHLGSAVEFTGAVSLESLPQRYQAADVFVNPTLRINGYDLTILQAMACSKPVVVSRLGSVPTAVVHEEEGLLVRPGDVRELSDAVAVLLSDKRLRLQMGENARRKVERDFGLEKMIDDTLGVYRSVLKDRGAKRAG